MKKLYLNTKPCARKQLCRLSSISARQKLRNPFNSDPDIPYMSLGDRIRLSADNGADIGAKITAVYDGEDSDNFNVLASFKHDVFDIAEEYGTLLDTQPAGESSDSPDSDSVV